jgi:hypothetical protein
MTKFKTGLLATWMAVVMLSGCPATTPTARLSVQSAIQAQARNVKNPAEPAKPALKTLPAAMASRVLSTNGAQAKLWGLNFTSAQRNIQKVYEDYTYQVWTRNMYGNRRLTTRYKTRVVYKDLGWILKYKYGGDGQAQHLGDGRFSYTVPTGKVFVLNTVENPQSVTVNGFVLGDGTARRIDVRYGISYVFGEGEVVVFNFGPNSSVSGFTADPELFAGVGFGAGAK